MPIKCSACILTYNSAKTLARCLESVKDFSDIVVMDGGSSDETLEIAGRYNARIFPQHEDGAKGEIDDFTEVRKKLFDKSAEDWVLWLDSDEWLSDGARNAIKDIVSDNGSGALHAFLRKVVIGGHPIEYAYFYPEYCSRLFNKHEDIFLKRTKKVHESLTAGLSVKIKKNDVIIYHSWQYDYEDLIKKDDYYLDLIIRGKEQLVFKNKMRISCINLLKGLKVLLKSLLIYLRHGLKKTLQIPYVWRFARYHFIYAKKILTIKPRNAGEKE